MTKPLPKFESGGVPLSVAYVVNQYPKVSHSFIRREILALENSGTSVFRYAIRGWTDTSLVDPDDIAERERTAYVLRQSPFAILRTIASTVLRHPRAVLAATSSTITMMRLAKSRRLVHLAYLAEAIIVANWAKKAGVHHIHSHFGTNAAEVAMLASCLTGLPYSFTVHGPEEFDKPEALGLGEKIKRAAFVCAISSYGRSQLWRWIPYADWRKIKIVRCGVDSRFLAVRPSALMSKNKIVCVGRLCEQKGQLLLVDAVAQLATRGVHVELVLAGDGEMRAEIEARITRQGVGDRVSITGWIGSDAVAKEIESSRALVLPSFAEGLPVVLMEAMALERPVISTYVAGIPELVADGKTGWLIPAGDLEKLTDAIAACIETPDEDLHAMGRQARAAVARMHDITMECAKLTGLFQASAAPDLHRNAEIEPVNRADPSPP